MMIRSNRTSSIPTKGAWGGHPDYLTIITINVRGIRSIVQNWYQEIVSFKTKWDKRIVEKKEEENEENGTKEKGTLLLDGSTKIETISSFSQKQS